MKSWLLANLSASVFALMAMIVSVTPAMAQDSVPYAWGEEELRAATVETLPGAICDQAFQLAQIAVNRSPGDPDTLRSTAGNYHYTEAQIVSLRVREAERQGEPLSDMELLRISYLVPAHLMPSIVTRGDLLEHLLGLAAGAAQDLEAAAATSNPSDQVLLIASSMQKGSQLMTIMASMIDGIYA